MLPPVEALAAALTGGAEAEGEAVVAFFEVEGEDQALAETGFPAAGLEQDLFVLPELSAAAYRPFDFSLAGRGGFEVADQGEAGDAGGGPFAVDVAFDRPGAWRFGERVGGPAGDLFAAGDRRLFGFRGRGASRSPARRPGGTGRADGRRDGGGAPAGRPPAGRPASGGRPSGRRESRCRAFGHRAAGHVGLVAVEDAPQGLPPPRGKAPP